MSGTTNVPSAYVLIKQGNKALFVLRQHTGFMDGNYAVPSGHVEDSESFIQAACRETLEEVGLKVKAEDLIHACTVHRKSINDIRVDVWFEAAAWEGEPKNMEPGRHSGIAWLDLNDLPANVMDYQRFAIDLIAKGQTYGETDWA